MNALETKNLNKAFGSLVVTDDISLQLPQGACHALICPNGAGKTTLINLMTGALTPDSGNMHLGDRDITSLESNERVKRGLGRTFQINTLIQAIMGFTALFSGSVHWRGEDITKLKPNQRAQAGIGWIPQRDIFSSLSVEENLTVIARKSEKDLWNLEQIYELFPRLQELRENKGSQLSGGEQQMLAIGRTLMTNPSMLLLDEPLEGLAPIVVEELGAAISKMCKEAGMILIMVEQHAETALAMTDDAVIIERGRIVHSAKAAELMADQAGLDRFIGLNLGD